MLLEQFTVFMAVSILFVQTSQPANAADLRCFEQASSRYSVPIELLRAISTVESSGNQLATHRNKNGSEDIGHMQINSGWLSTLSKYGIDKLRLADPCVNTHVGAWILANNFNRMGYSWQAVGAYNAKSPDKAAIYVRKVANVLRHELKKGTQID